MTPEFEVIEHATPAISKPTYLIVGLPDAGLVGSITTEFLIENYGLKEFGEVYSTKYIPPIMHVTDGIAKSPLRLYYSQSPGIIVFHAWTALPSNAIYPLAKLVVEYSKKYDVSKIISITGLPIQNRLEIDKPKAYWISNNAQLSVELEKTGLMEKFGDGYIAGPYAPILMESWRAGLDNFVIAVESFLDLPDPEASAVALDILSKYIGFKVDVSSLLQQAEEIRERIKGLMEQTKKELPSYTLGKPMTYT
ncbi:MAG: proteasome assembly chaperone family protein [Candidatus Aramenus sp.]|nr:proteasome assembly chaperone family protein [Candidatus Aramenus sp.]